MTNIEILSDVAAEKYENHLGAPTHGSLSAEQGDLMGMDGSGKLVHATADSAGGGSEAAGPIAFLGCLLADHVTDMSSYTENELNKAALDYKRKNDTLAGEHRAAVLEDKFYIQNTDQDWAFTPGEPVYLSTTGGLTQTAPSGTGTIAQVVGVAANPPHGDVPAGEAVWVDPEMEYTSN